MSWTLRLALMWALGAGCGADAEPPCEEGFGRAADGDCYLLEIHFGDSREDTGEPPDPCPEPLELRASSAVADHGDPFLEGSAAALIEAVPEGCEALVVLDGDQPWPVLSDLVFPSWTTAVFSSGARLEIAAGTTVTLNGGVEAERSRIVSDSGEVLGEPSIEAAWPEWFGAVRDDEQDDHLGLQRALEFFPVVSLEGGVYDLADALVLSDGARLEGPASGDSPATLTSALVYPSSGGFHPTRMLEAFDASDIAVRDLVLDGNRHAHEVEPWDYPETDNLARFERVEGLVFERVHITGWEANWGIADQSYAHATAVVDSSEVSWVDVRFTDSRTEGLVFERCEDVSIERLSTQNTDVWTPLNVFYVRGFQLTDSTIVEDEGIEWSGSTLNLTVSDALVSGNTLTGGWGVDLGDETGTSPFGPSDLVVEDNVIEVVGAGIYLSPYVADDRVTDVVIRGNHITLHRGSDPSVTDTAIRVDASAEVLIEDNVIEVPDTGQSMVQGVALRGHTDGVVIQDNILTGVDTGVAHSGDASASGDLVVRRNTITCADEIRVNSWNGGSTGVWVFRYVAAEFGAVTVEDNEIQGSGGWVSLIDYATLSSDPPPFVDALVVTGNSFLPESGSERDVFSKAAASVTITGNTPDWVNR